MKNRLNTMVSTQSLIAVLLIFSVSCFPKKTYFSPPEKVEKSCTPYFKYIKNNWKKNKENYFVFEKPPSYDSTLHTGYEHINKPCIEGLSKKQILYFFGEPSIVKDTVFIYYMREGCFKENRKPFDCSFFSLVFDKQIKNVMEVRLPTYEGFRS